MAYNQYIYSKGTTSYKDLDISFGRNPATNDIRVKSDVEAIKQSVKNLIMLNYGDLPFRPLFGGNLRAQLFENATTQTARDLETSIRSVLTEEPRVQVIEVKVNEDTFDSNAIVVKLVVNILNAEQPIEIPLILRRTR